MRRVNPVSRYVRARLHRRIFFLLGASIFVTGLIFGIGQWSIGGQEWKTQVEMAKGFLGGRFARVWDKPEERDELARSMADELRLDVRLETKDRAPLATFGAECKRPVVTVPVQRDGETLGYASICADRMHPKARGRTFLPVLLAAFILWVGAGKLARRLSRPYGELARVAKDIGMGKLSTRFAISRRDAHGEARILADAINDMADRIEKQMKDQRELLAGVSHEIRTPLARIRLLVELCRSQSEAGRHVVDGKTLDEIDREVVEIDSLVSELLASSRLDFAALTPHALDAADVARRALERQGLPVGKLRAQPGSTRITADATLLSRALANLIENATVHGGGLEALVVRTDGATLFFEALDRGPGLLPGEETRVFESFYQRPSQEPREAGADSTGALRANERVGALGLGLTLVKRIAEAHGGRAFAENREGGGARVGVELPRGETGGETGDEA